MRHPFIEAGMTKQDIRAMSRRLGLASADLPASPCLASRLYTGTPVTEQRLAAVEHGEEFLKEQAGIQSRSLQNQGRCNAHRSAQ